MQYYKITISHTTNTTNKLTPWRRVLPDKLTGPQLVKTVPTFYGTRRFITASRSGGYLSLPLARSIQSIFPHPVSWRSIFILSLHIRLGLPSCLLPSGLPTKPLCVPHLSPLSATCPAHLILRDLIIWIMFGEEYTTGAAITAITTTYYHCY